MGLLGFFKKKTAVQHTALTGNEYVSSLIEKGYVQTMRHKTPNGGDYSEAHFLDKNHNHTSKEKADIMVIKEFKDDGTMIHETFMYRR